MANRSLQDVMSRKNYYRDTYRRVTKWLQYMLALKIALLLAIAQVYFTRDEPDYYATNSASSIKSLMALNEPNYSSKALLPPDRPEELGIKTVSI